MRMKGKVKALPPSFRPLLWSYDFSRLNAQRDKKVIIIQVLNYGDLDEWRLLLDLYGKRGVQKTLDTIATSELRTQVRPLVAALFTLKHLPYVSRGVRSRK